jgi:uncharacterized FlaG/YvyC family protein
MTDPLVVPVNNRGSEVLLPHFSPKGGGVHQTEPIKPVQSKGEGKINKDMTQDPRTMANKVQAANEMLQSLTLGVRFEIDEAVLGNVRIVMVDKNNQVIREIPEKKMGSLLSKAKKFQDGELDKSDLSGLLIERKV